MAVIAFIYLLIPAVIIVLAGLNAGDYLRFPPEGFSLRWVQDFLTSPTFLPAYLFSLRLAFVTMVIATILGTMTAIFLTRANFPGRGAVRAFFLAPLLLPGLVLGLALYCLLHQFPHRRFAWNNLGDDARARPRHDAVRDRHRLRVTLWF